MKAYILLCEGFEEVEALTTADVLSRAGAKVEFISPYGDEYVTGSHGITVKTDKRFEQSKKFRLGKGLASDYVYRNAEFGDADAVILPGGQPGTRNLAANSGVRAMIDNYNEAGKYVCAICAAPTVLGANGLLDSGSTEGSGGRRCTCFPGCEDGLGKGNFIGGPAVTDGNIITGKSMGCAVDFALAIVKALFGEEKASSVEQAIHRQ